MRIKVDQLSSTLDKSGLAPVYCISGDEPLQMLEAVDQIRQFARSNGVEERTVLNVERGFDWNSLAEAGANLSLFSSRRLLELRLGTNKPGRDGGAALVNYTAALRTDNILLITTGKIDKKTQNTNWYKSLDQAGVTVQVWPVEAAALPAWIVQRARNYGKTLQREAAALIAQKVEGNLLAARQELEKLCLLTNTPEISVAQVMSAVNDSARYDIFALIENACQGNTEHTARMLRGLKNEGIEPIGIFGALMWELRRICAMADAIEGGAPRERVFTEYRVWPQRKPAISKLLKRLPARHLTSLLGTAYLTDRCLKGATRRDPWELLENLLLCLAGARSIPVI